MTEKDMAKDVINTLPSKVTLDDIFMLYMFEQNFGAEKKKFATKKAFHTKMLKKDYGNG